jgi:hypothetical protein
VLTAAWLSEKEAWLELRNAIAAEKVKVRGFPYQEKIVTPPTQPSVAPPVEISKWTYAELIVPVEEPDDDDEPEPTNCPLPAAEAGALVPGSSIGVLRPLDWAIKGGQGWRGLVVSRADLAKEFPVDVISDDKDDQEDEGDDDNRQESVPSFASDDLEWKSRLLRETIREKWPAGVPRMRPAERNTMIEEMFRQKLKAKAQSENLSQLAIECTERETLGASTIRKALKDIRNGK